VNDKKLSVSDTSSQGIRTYTKFLPSAIKSLGGVNWIRQYVIYFYTAPNPRSVSLWHQCFKTYYWRKIYWKQLFNKWLPKLTFT